MGGRRFVSGLCLLVLVGGSITVGSWTAAGATCKKTIVVKSTGDSATPRAGQLRTAIADVCNGGTIRLHPGIVIRLAQGQLVIPSGKTVTIVSASQRRMATIDAHGASRVLWVQSSAHLTLGNLIVRGGSDAGINNEGSLAIAGGRVTGNMGSGIRNLGTAILSDGAAITTNQGRGILNGLRADNVPGHLILEDDSTVTGNVSTDGGGVFNFGVVTLNDTSSVTGNVASSSGGGIHNVGDDSEGVLGVLTMNDNSSISGNEAEFGGGGVFHDFGGRTVLNDTSRISENVTMSGRGAGLEGRGSVIMNDGSSVVANTGMGVRMIRGPATLNDHSSIADNEGTGLFALGVGATLNDQSSITGNEGNGLSIVEAASGILNDESTIAENGRGATVQFGTLRLNDSSSVTRNTNQTRGGGILNEDGRVFLHGASSISENVAPLGGGIYNFGEGGSIVELNDTSTITRNTATEGQGGGVYNEAGTVTLNDDSSISGNIPDDCFPTTAC
jgi:hypothetical protein